MVAWHRPNEPFPARAAAMGAREAGMGAGLVQEDDGGRIERRHGGAPGGAVEFVAFGSDQGLFLRVRPIRLSARCIAATLTASP